MLEVPKSPILIKLKRKIAYFLTIIKIEICRKPFYAIQRIRHKKNELEVMGNRDKDNLYIICPYGIGDILVGALLADKLRKKNKYKDKNKVVFLIRSNYSSMGKALKEFGECVADTRLAKKKEEYVIFTKQFHGKNYIYGHFPKNKDKKICYGICVNDYVWQDYCVYVYHVKKDSLFHIVDTSGFENNLREKRKVIICPYAYSTGMLPEKFWETLVEKLRQRNYQIYTNVSSSEKEVRGTERLECSLSEILDIANSAKAVIAMRSGICDLLAVKSLAPLFVINDNEGLAKYWNLEYLREKGICNFLVRDSLAEDILEQLEKY